MSRFKNTSTGDVFDVPDTLDAMYGTRPGCEPFYPTTTEVPDVPAATAPAGATGDSVPTFDPDEPLAAGALGDLGLTKGGDATEKRARLAEYLNKEDVNG